VVTNPGWLNDFTITDEDIEHLNSLLLEHEIPMDVTTLARAIIEERVRKERERLKDRFKDAVLYDPAHTFEVGQRVVFSTFDFAMGEVVATRQGDNGEYGEFGVVGVTFDDPGLNTGESPREFAMNFPVEHALNAGNGQNIPYLPTEDLNIEDIFESDAFDDILDMVDERLQEDDSLIRVAGQWFSKELMLDANEGHMHLAEAILDMFGGGPLSTEEVLENIGGLGEEPLALQVFSMNYAMNNDNRFDEVGPTGEVLWYLRRMEPEQVQQTPPMLRYEPIPYDHDALSAEAQRLEEELGDEHSPLPFAPARIQEARVISIYPHRRCGTLPLNHQAARIFPTARTTEHVSVTLVDASDNETFPGWVVRSQKYVHGLAPLYSKHALPIGSTIRLRRGDEPGHIVVDFQSYKPRSEYVTIVSADEGQIGFETAKRGIGADFDELLLLGVDDLDGVDRLFQSNPANQQPLATILRVIIPMLGKLTAQGHVHAKTLYSVVNVVRRCPPGPIFATLENNPDFENVGGHYWKLS
jgi:hypothetical protein